MHESSECPECFTEDCYMFKANDSEGPMLPPEEGKSRGRELLALLNSEEQPAVPPTEPNRARLCSTAALFVPQNNSKKVIDSIRHAIWVTFTSAIRCLAVQPQESCTALHLTLVGQTGHPETLQALTSGLTTSCPAIVEATPAPDASLLQLTLLLASRDQICWEYFRHGECPRPCCRWQHAAPEVVIVVLHLLHPGGDMSCMNTWAGVQEQQRRQEVQPQLQPQQQTPWVNGAPHGAVGMQPVHLTPSPWAITAVEHRGQGSNYLCPVPGMNSMEVSHYQHATRENAQAWPHAACMPQQGARPMTPRGIPKPLQESQGLHIPPTEVLASMESTATRTPSPECRHPTSVAMASNMKNCALLPYLPPHLGRVLWADIADEGDAV